MHEHTKTEHDLATRPLLSGVLDLLGAHRPAFRQQRVFDRAQAVVFGQWLSLGRHTITQGLVTVGLVDDDWSAFYRLCSEDRINWPTLRRCQFRETLRHVEAGEPYVVGLDGVQVGRHSRTMPGTSWLRAPQTPVWKVGIQRAQRFVDVAWLTPRSAAGYSRAIPLDWVPALPAKAVPAAGVAPQREWEVGLAEARWLRQELDAAGRAGQRLLLVADGVYDTVGLWRRLPERTVLVVRTAKNRVLRGLPGAAGGRGRPRRYGERVARPDAWLRERTGWRQTVLRVRGREIPVTYRVEGPVLRQGAPQRPLYLVVVKGIKRRVNGKVREREPVFLLVNAAEVGGRWVLPLPVEELMAWAWQRWELEVTHRACKAEFGVGEVQCWGERSALRAVQVQVWAVSLLLLAGYRTWGLGPGTIRSPGRWWRGSGRWSFGRLWQGFRQEVWGEVEFRRIWLGTEANWAEKVDWLQARQQAVQGLRRA